MSESTIHTVEITLREPVTLEMLERACGCVGRYEEASWGRRFVPVHADDVLDDPRAALTGAHVPPSKQADLLLAICEEPPDLAGLSLEAREVVIARTLTDFFADACLAVWVRRATCSPPTTAAPASRPGAAMA